MKNGRGKFYRNLIKELPLSCHGFFADAYEAVSVFVLATDFGVFQHFGGNHQHCPCGISLS